MTSPTALATPSDLAAFVEETISDEDARALSVLGMASALVAAYVARDYTEHEDVPEAVKGVTVDVASRVWMNPGGLTRDGVADVQHGYGERAHERFYLTPANRMVLDRVRQPRRSGLYTITTTRDDRLDARGFVPTAPGSPGQGMPFIATDEDQ